MVFDEAANHAGDQSRADAVSHDVADQDTGGGFAEGKDAEEIAADVTGRKVQTQETQGAFLGRHIGRDGRKLLRKKSDLEFACHLQFLFHLLVLFAQLLGALLDAFFQLRVQGEKFLLGSIPGGLGSIDSPAYNLRNLGDNPGDQSRGSDGAYCRSQRRINVGPVRQLHIDPAIDERGADDNGDESPQQNRLGRIAKARAPRPGLRASRGNETQAAEKKSASAGKSDRDESAAIKQRRAVAVPH